MVILNQDSLLEAASTAGILAGRTSLAARPLRRLNGVLGRLATCLYHGIPWADKGQRAQVSSRGLSSQRKRMLESNISWPSVVISPETREKVALVCFSSLYMPI